MKNKILKTLVVEESKALAIKHKQILELKWHKVVVTHDEKIELEIYEKELKNYLS